MAIEQKKSEAITNKYNSNPFTLAFEALGNLFNTNVGWAIAIVILGFLGSFIQLIGEIGRSFNQSSNSTAAYDSLANSTSGSVDATLVIATVIFIATAALFALVIFAVCNTYIQGMLSYVALKSEERKTVGFSEAFQATTKRFWRLFLAQTLAGLKIFGWSLLFIIPGIIAAIRYTLLPYVIMNDSEEKGRVGESHNDVKALVSGRKMEVFGVATVGTIIPIVGSLLKLSGNAALFKQLHHYNQYNLEKPKVHWLNYIGLILLAVLIPLVSTIVVVIALIASRSS